MVVVAFVPVAFTKVKFWREEELVTFKFRMVAALETNKLVVEAVPWTESVVVVAFVPVAWRKVKLASEEEAEARKFTVVTVPVAVTFATLTISPEIKAPP